MRIQDVPYTIVVGFLGLYSRGVMLGLNDTSIKGNEELERIIHDEARRERNQGLITVMNHVTTIDDPAAVAIFLSPADMTIHARERARWTMCATDRCFRNPFVSKVLSWGKVIPVERGKGIHQPGMDRAVELLEDGDWINVFPEGRRSRTGKLQIPLRAGVGRLVADAKVCPVVVPVVHRGIEQVLPRGAWLPLTSGKPMTVRVGKPIEFGPLVSRLRAQGTSEAEVYEAVTAEIQAAMLELEEEAETDHAIALGRSERA
jgi:monolysocardiolipin acyltransferase